MVSLKSTLRLYAVSLLSFGAVTVATVFLNYYFDLSALAVPQKASLYALREAQLTMCKVVVACAGGILGLITAIVLLFAMAHEIERNRARLGLLKALGYSSWEIARSFFRYGAPALLGAVAGYAAGMLLAVPTYASMSEFEALTPQVHFHALVPLTFVFLLPAVMGLLSVAFAARKLKKPALALLRERGRGGVRRSIRTEQSDAPFLTQLRRTLRRNHPMPLLFVILASWGFSAMVQMAFTMLSVEMSAIAPVIAAPIGLMMGVVMMVLSADFILRANRPYLSLMKAYGYTERACYRAVLGGYRPAAWFGFALGTLYQFFLMRGVVALFAGSYDVEVRFQWQGLGWAALLFIALYESIQYVYRRKIAALPLRQVMEE